MLNYIWAGLIVSSFIFALGHDLRDLVTDAYRNGAPLPVQIAFPEGYDADAREQPVRLQVDVAAYRAFYRTGEEPAPAYSGVLISSDDGLQLRFGGLDALPEPLATIRGVSQSAEGELQGTLTGFEPANAEAQCSRPLRPSSSSRPGLFG